MSTVEAILNVVDSISNWFGLLINRITIFYNSVLNILSYIGGILEALWYGLISILSGIWDLAVEVIEGGVFINVGSAFGEIAKYIGGPATVFISTLLFIIIFRIFVAFLFKIFRLNIDYHALQSRTHTINTRSQIEAMKEKQRLFNDFD